MRRTKRQRHPRGEFTVREFKTPAGETVWRVSGIKMDGSRVRSNFKREDAARAEKQRLEAEAANFEAVPLIATKLTKDQVVDAEKALGELKAGNLVTAVRFFNEHYQDPLDPIKLTDAVDRFIDEAEGRNLRPETVNNLKFRLGALVEFTPESRLVWQILPEHIKAFLQRKNGKARGFRTIRNDQLALSNFFNWAKTNRHCTTNPMEAVQNVKVDRKKPGIFDAATVRRLLNAAVEYEDGKTVPYFVLGLFCGLRPTEAARLTWDKIDLTDKLITIETDGTKVRGGSERFVPISDNAVVWLTPHALKRTPLAIDREGFEAVKTLAKLDKWPQDVLRHTALSNHLAQHHHEGLTAEFAGNSVEVIKRFYRRAIKPKDAEEFWTITPDAMRGETIQLPNPQAEPRHKAAS
jgi:integrase